ncbi:MAG: hypothetical protein JSU65_04960 [Candidatus Zixiibacteriota bacterium]|nr:MAG: hypothetical protein JSU65_04960 [candidate division Zixibacteria bacterium]
MRGILRDTVIELLDRKIIWVFAVIVVLAVLILLVTDDIGFRFGVGGSGEMDLGQLNEVLGNPILRGFDLFMAFLVFLAVVASAGIFPGMLQRGRTEFYMSKPISRASLLRRKVFAIWVVYGGLVLVSGFLVYLAAGLFHGAFDGSILVLQLLALVSLLIWLSVSILFGVLSRSTVASLMAVLLVWVVEWVLSYREFFKSLTDSSVGNAIIDTVYFIFPKPDEVSDIFLRIASDRTVWDWQPVWTTLAAAFVLFYLSTMIIKRQDF